MLVNINHKRKETAFLKAIATIISEEVTNVNISYTTVTGVKLSNDGSHLNVYVTFDSHPNKSLEALSRTKGFIRSRFAQSSHSRKVPELHFKLDTSFEEGQKIEEILKRIKSGN